jgi:hypothetical protein
MHQSRTFFKDQLLGPNKIDSVLGQNESDSNFKLKKVFLAWKEFCWKEKLFGLVCFCGFGESFVLGSIKGEDNFGDFLIEPFGDIISIFSPDESLVKFHKIS